MLSMLLWLLGFKDENSNGHLENSPLKPHLGDILAHHPPHETTPPVTPETVLSVLFLESDAFS